MRREDKMEEARVDEAVSMWQIGRGVGVIVCPVVLERSDSRTEVEIAARV